MSLQNWSTDVPSGDRDNGEPECLKAERNYKPHDHPFELFNLQDDAAERDNLYADHPELVKEFQNLLEMYKTSPRSVPHEQG